ncbi:ras and EF-hand domain-containing protein [Thalassophryne amazonica]|uniref:ras and EF-hand domain-containing protein n=1 Tax=Thalassophryne amazonica TaxID=390379 RepID=UPI0014712570|nr:ras and EF-hand domain-containing protein [Thalassophryne amazonica]
MDKVSLHRLFSACDVNKSGRIEYDDFTVICRDLNVPEGEIKGLFDRFDADQDGFIDYNNFSSRFQEVSETLDLASFGGGSNPSQDWPWEDSVVRFDVESVLSESLREQLANLYWAIHATANMTLLLQYEEIVHSLISKTLDNRMECEQLETSLKRAEEMNSSQLAELDEDMQQQLSRTEERVRDEERRRMAGIMASMEARLQNEVSDLHDRLSKSQKESESIHSKDEVDKLNRQIRDLSTENDQLRACLQKAQTDIAILRSELDRLKNICADQKRQYERETDDLKRMVVEYQSYSEQVEILQEVNKKLYDSNDGLHSQLASDMAARRRRAPQNEIPARKMKPVRQSTIDCDSFKQDFSKPHVPNWASIDFPDSGVSLQMDTGETSGSDYESDESIGPPKTVNPSFLRVPSDAEISDITSACVPSMHRSRSNSISSSSRRRLSAFLSKPSGEGIFDDEEPAPMYRLVLAGDAGAGKSSFLLRLTLNEFREDIQTTLGIDFQMKTMLVDGQTTSLQIWDTAGQERFRSIAKSYFRKADGVLLLYDVTSESSFLHVRAWVDQIQDSTNEKIPMCIIGNKVDLRERFPQRCFVSTADGEKLAKAYGALFCETSAKEGTNIVEAVLHLAREVKKDVNLREQSVSSITLNSTSSKKTFSDCCRV